MNIIEVKHAGQARMDITYNPNGSQIITDAPADHGGRGEYPSPVALMAEALAACALTTACIWSQKYDVDTSRFNAEVESIDVDAATSSVAAISIAIHLPAAIADDMRPRIESAVMRGCTVGNTLKAEKKYIFRYDA